MHFLYTAYEFTTHYLGVIFGALSTFVHWAYQVVGATVHLGVDILYFLIVLAILKLITGKLSKQNKHPKAHRFLHVHKQCKYVLQPSLRKVALQNAVAALSPGAVTLRAAVDKPVAVLKFDGDVRATGREQLARLVDEIVTNREKLDSVIAVVNSPGGGVAEYGHVYAEMERIRSANLALTVCSDTYAASGGYLMSLPANKIVAAPFAMIGSIGVVTEFLNFHEFVKNLGITPITVTAGTKKRNVTQFNDPTPEAQEELSAQLKAIHEQFKRAVSKYRPGVNVDEICTGEHWSAQQAFDDKLGLVDEIATSQEYLLRARESKDLLFLSNEISRFEKGIFRFLTNIIDYTVDGLLARAGMRNR
ncbi:MAG TPA: S49 family peptidase [Planktothrix sp.]|jgi:signal peptide peptidase SppA